MATKIIKRKSSRIHGQASQTLLKTKPFIAGLWKFKDKVPLGSLITMAERWAKTNPGYVQLFIRQVGHGENGIAFIYQPRTKIPLESYLEKTSQELKKVFGNDLSGWDVATSLWILK